jgi:hypothetical protein
MLIMVMEMKRVKVLNSEDDDEEFEGGEKRIRMYQSFIDL